VAGGTLDGEDGTTAVPVPSSPPTAVAAEKVGGLLPLKYPQTDDHHDDDDDDNVGGGDGGNGEVVSVAVGAGAGAAAV